MNNLVYCKENLIPQNDKTNYILSKSDLFKNSIQIEIKILENINIFNLFLILKSFILNNDILINGISFASLDIENKIMIFEREPNSRLKKVRYNEFFEWINWRIEKDRGYKVTQNFYCIMISFNEVIIKEKNIDLDNLKPIFPWKEDFINTLKKNGYLMEYDLVEIKEKENYRLKKEIEELKKEIEELKKEKN